MKAVQDLIPWKVIDLGLRPFPDLWSFNNSIHFDGETWRCVLRCADYCMPGGKTVRSKGASPMGQQTKNALVILDPTSWRSIKIFEMREQDGFPRTSTPHRGFEDMRIFRTDKGGLQGIAASLHLKREHRTGDGMPQHQPPEQVLLSFDGEYNIVAAQPLRGEGWSGMSQKNWVPFDNVAEPRFLYSISKGALFDDRGPVHGDAARVRPSASASPGVSTTEIPPVASPAPTPPPPPTPPPQKEAPPSNPAPDRRTPIRGGEARVIRGGRVALDTMTSRPSSRPSPHLSVRSTPHSSARPSPRPYSRAAPTDSTRMLGSGRILLPKYSGLRGGTQLVRVGEDAWLGIGHEMKFVSGRKYYWHVFFLVDSRGKMKAVGPPCKLAPEGIEFAAGMAIDGDRVVVSFGVDDMNCRLGETSLSALLATLMSVEAK